MEMAPSMASSMAKLFVVNLRTKEQEQTVIVAATEIVGMALTVMILMANLMAQSRLIAVAPTMTMAATTRAGVIKTWNLLHI